MNSRIVIAIILTLALLVTVGALGYQVTQHFIRYKVTEDLYSQIYGTKGGNDSPEAVKAQAEELRTAADHYGGDRLEGMLVDRLAYLAWFYPDKNVEPLAEIFRRAPQLGESEDMCPYVQIADYLRLWAYQCAVLPEQVEGMADVVIARRPDLRQTVRNLQAYVRLMNDDLAGVKDLALSEMNARGGAYDARGLAMSCSVLTGDYVAAQKYSEGLGESSIGDVNIKLQYCDLLVQQQRFAEAEKVARSIVAVNPSNDLYMSLAVPLYAQHGQSNPELRDTLQWISQSTRNPMSEAGAEAWVAGRCFEVSGDLRFSERLRLLARQNPRDYDVWAAQADCLMNRSMWLESEDMRKLLSSGLAEGLPADNHNGKPSTKSQPFDSSEALDFARQAAALAQTPAQRQMAQLLLARAQLYSGDRGRGPAGKQELLRHLRAALGLSSDDEAVKSERVPDYDVLLVDMRLRALRDADAAFSEQVHGAVKEYVQQRTELFTPSIEEGNKLREKYKAAHSRHSAQF